MPLSGVDAMDASRDCRRCSRATVIFEESSKPSNHYSTRYEKKRGCSERNLHIERTPKKADQKTRNEVADSVDNSKHAENHTMLLFQYEFGNKGIFERFFDANI